MRSWIASGGVLWMCLAAELAWPTALPHGSLLFPLICAMIYWSGSSGSIMLAGTVLIVDWIVRPMTIPLNAMIVPFLAVMFLSASVPTETFVRSRSPLRWIPQPLHLPLMTILVAVLHVLSDNIWRDFTVLPLLIRVVPVSACLSMLIRVSDELGLRRPRHQTVL